MSDSFNVVSARILTHGVVRGQEISDLLFFRHSSLPAKKVKTFFVKGNEFFGRCSVRDAGGVRELEVTDNVKSTSIFLTLLLQIRNPKFVVDV